MGDIRLFREGAIFLMSPLSAAGETWLRGHAPDGALCINEAVVVLACQLHSVLQRAQAHGIIIET